MTRVIWQDCRNHIFAILSGASPWFLSPQTVTVWSHRLSFYPATSDSVLSKAEPDISPRSQTEPAPILGGTERCFWKGHLHKLPAMLVKAGVPAPHTCLWSLRGRSECRTKERLWPQKSNHTKQPWPSSLCTGQCHSRGSYVLNFTLNFGATSYWVIENN